MSHQLTGSENMDNIIVDTNNEFVFNIFNTLAKDGNDVLSPVSILSAFSIVFVNCVINVLLIDTYNRYSHEWSEQ